MGLTNTLGSQHVQGNLSVDGQTSTTTFKVTGANGSTTLTAGDGNVSFKGYCKFAEDCEFNGGQTLIGVETTYGTAYIGSPTVQVGNRLVVGDSLFRVLAEDRTIVADTFSMTLAKLDVDKVRVDNLVADLLKVSNIKLSGKLDTAYVAADEVHTPKVEASQANFAKVRASDSVTTKDLVVSGQTKMGDGLVIDGSGTTGTSLTVNGGQIVANEGIVSHTANNRFQTLNVMGSGTDHEVCFRVDRNVDSVFEGDVTIENANLILDGSKLVVDKIMVSSLKDGATHGLDLSSDGSDWETYRDSMVVEEKAEESARAAQYDPYAQVAEAIQRNADNYAAVERAVKSILNPISYLDEQRDSNVPARFSIKPGVHRIDSAGDALLRNVVAESGRFSSLSAYEFKANQFQADKLVVTSVASNVVDTDNLLKARGIAEFDGVVNSKADVFVEGGSQVSVADGAKVEFRKGSTLKIQDGASFEVGTSSPVSLKGDVELDIARLVLLDSTTGRKYRLNFVESETCDGGTCLQMTYEKVSEPQATTTEKAVEKTSRAAADLNSRLKSLGL